MKPTRAEVAREAAPLLREMVERHRREVTAASDRPGRGRVSVLSPEAIEAAAPLLARMVEKGRARDAQIASEADAPQPVSASDRPSRVAS